MELVAGQKTFISRTQYSTDYRFRLWVALVNDIVRMDLKHRTYLEHYVYLELGLAEDKGYKFLNPKGGRLIWTQLKTDDIWGFLGKQYTKASSPGRNISAYKFAVLDLFFRYKYPKIALSFDKSEEINALAINHVSFLSEPDSNFYSSDFDERCAAVEGLYISNQHIRNPEIKEAFTVSDSFEFKLPMLVIRRLPDQRFCIVHRIEWPLSEEIFDTETEQYVSALKYRHWLSKKTSEYKTVYSGIGIPCNSMHSKHAFTLSVFLRHRAFKHPYHAELSVRPLHSLEDEGYTGTLDVKASSGLLADTMFKYIDRSSIINYPDNIYEKRFLDNIRQIYNELGTEV